MKNKITQSEFELLVFLKSSQDQLKRLSNRFYYYARRLLELEDDNYLTDYFDNDICSVTEFLNHVNIDVEVEDAKD